MESPAGPLLRGTPPTPASTNFSHSLVCFTTIMLSDSGVLQGVLLENHKFCWSKQVFGQETCKSREVLCLLKILIV